MIKYGVIRKDSPRGWSLCWLTPADEHAKQVRFLADLDEVVKQLAGMKEAYPYEKYKVLTVRE